MECGVVRFRGFGVDRFAPTPLLTTVTIEGATDWQAWPPEKGRTDALGFGCFEARGGRPRKAGLQFYLEAPRVMVCDTGDYQTLRARQTRKKKDGKGVIPLASPEIGGWRRSNRSGAGKHGGSERLRALDGRGAN